MKKLLAAVLCAALLCGSLSLAVSADAEEKREIGRVTLEKLGEGEEIAVDGVLDDPAWEKTPVRRVDGSNSALIWSYRSLVNAEIDVGFLICGDGIAVSAAVRDPHTVLSTGKNDVASTDEGYDPSDDYYGYNGDVFIFSLDPLDLIDSDAELRSDPAPWYCISPFEDGSLRVYASRANNDRDVSDLVEGAYTADDDGWYFELIIPWSVIRADIASLTGRDAPDVSDLTADGARHDAMVIYLDRYVYGSGEIGMKGVDPLCFDPQLKTYSYFHPKRGVTYTISRWSTICDVYYEDGEELLGAYGNGVAAKLYGIRLEVDGGHRCVPGDPEEAVAPSHTERGYDRVFCTECGELTDLKDKGFAHTLGDWKDAVPATCRFGVAVKECSECGACPYRKMLPAVGTHAEGAPAIHVDKRLKEDRTFELYCTDCGEKVDATADTINIIFRDIPDGAWYCGAAAYCFNRGIITGTAPRAFSPSGATTRAAMVQILARVCGADLENVKFNARFNDVNKGAWYASAVCWALDSGITSGVSETRFAPNASVTREQIVLFLMKTAVLLDFDVSARADLSALADRAAVSSWAYEAMSWAVASGLISGRSGNMIAPRANATRAETAQMIMKFCKLVSGR